VVAVRVTSEDANAGFKPTCGSIDELSFRTSPDVWGYFSVKSGGGIHEFSDSQARPRWRTALRRAPAHARPAARPRRPPGPGAAGARHAPPDAKAARAERAARAQFGHLFAKGDTREAATRAMVVALKEVKIRGEIRTIVDYAVEMIQSGDFVNNNIHTGWLDARIAQHVRARRPAGCTARRRGARRPGARHGRQRVRRRRAPAPAAAGGQRPAGAAQVKAEKPAWYLAVISGALLRTLDFVAARSAEYLSDLGKGQLPPARLTLTAFEETFVLEGAPPARARVRSASLDRKRVCRS